MCQEELIEVTYLPIKNVPSLAAEVGGYVSDTFGLAGMLCLEFVPLPSA